MLARHYLLELRHQEQCARQRCIDQEDRGVASRERR
jgi:hypothetical protein